MLVWAFTYSHISKPSVLHGSVSTPDFHGRGTGRELLARRAEAASQPARHQPDDTQARGGAGRAAPRSFFARRHAHRCRPGSLRLRAKDVEPAHRSARSPDGTAPAVSWKAEHCRERIHVSLFTAGTRRVPPTVSDDQDHGFALACQPNPRRAAESPCRIGSDLVSSQFAGVAIDLCLQRPAHIHRSPQASAQRTSARKDPATRRRNVYRAQRAIALSIEGHRCFPKIQDSAQYERRAADYRVDQEVCRHGQWRGPAATHLGAGRAWTQTGKRLGARAAI